MTLTPATVAAVQDAVRAHSRIGLRGGGTKSDPLADVDRQMLELRALSGVIEYTPAECVITARSGTTITEIESLLAAHGQYLPFDPPLADRGATLGGTLGAGVSGPRRYRYGGVRDFVIGIELVDGEGRAFRSGGKVVKNAAGFLLHHGVVGSGGRFGVLTEVSLKVFPQPEARGTVRAECGEVHAAHRLAQELARAGGDCEAIDFTHTGTLSVTLAGRRRSLEPRLEGVQKLIADLSKPRGHTAERAGTEVGAGTEVPVGTEVGVGTEVATVKVGRPLRSWHVLAPHVQHATFHCAGAVGWLQTHDVGGLATALQTAGLAGLVFSGPGAGRRIGHWPANEFERRVRHALDPRGRFHAAPDLG